jgi:hypothetical protein
VALLFWMLEIFLVCILLQLLSYSVYARTERPTLTFFVFSHITKNSRDEPAASLHFVVCAQSVGTTEGMSQQSHCIWLSVHCL